MTLRACTAVYGHNLGRLTLGNISHGGSWPGMNDCVDCCYKVAIPVSTKCCGMRKQTEGNSNVEIRE